MADKSKPNSYVVKITLDKSDKLLADMRNQGFEISTPPNTLFSGRKKGVVCTLYKTGKLVVQGGEMATFIEFYLEPEIIGAFTYSYAELSIDTSAHIGIDEAGKGDFFGPLCIAGVYGAGDEILKLKELGVRDSKSMTDNTVKKVAEKIKKSYKYHIVKINPAKYNELYEKFRNLNHLLAWGHATTIEKLLEQTQCKKIIIDQFAAEYVVASALKRKNLDVELIQRHRGEEDLVVAAASILARETFLDGLDKLGQEFNVKLPKGASSEVITVGKKLLAQNGRDMLGKVAKLHFKTFNAIMGIQEEFEI